MAIVTISREVAAELYNTRSIKSDYDRKTAKKRIFSRIKSENGIPSSTKIKINILNEDSDTYLQVRNKRSGIALTNSLPEPTIAVVKGATAVNESKTEVKTVAPSKVPTKAPAKVPAKPVAKVAAKPVTKVAAKPTPAAKAAVAAKPLGSPVKTAKFTIEVRATLNGKRVRLGYASSEKMKQQMVDKAKASN